MTPTCLGFFSRCANQECQQQLFMLLVSFVKCAQTIPFNTTVPQHNMFPHVQTPQTMFEMCMLESKHGNAILHMELSTSVVGEGKSVGSWWKQELSPPHRGGYQGGRLKRKQLEISRYADTKTIFIQTLVFDVTHDSSSLIISIQVSHQCCHRSPFYHSTHLNHNFTSL